jgi:hypothetical protein
LLWSALYLLAGDGPAVTPFWLTPCKSQKGETEMEKKAITQHDLHQFTGDLERYGPPMNRRVIYTPGVRFLADRRANAYWLVDAITSFFGSKEMAEAFECDDRLKDLQFWRLNASADASAVLSRRADFDVAPSSSSQSPTRTFLWKASISGLDTTASSGRCIYLQSINGRRHILCLSAIP